MYWLLFLFFLFYFIVSWYKFELGLALLFFFLPAYLIRFKIGFVPTTALEVMVGIISLVWLIKYKRKLIPKLKGVSKKHTSLFYGCLLFLLSASFSVFTAQDLLSAAGKWKAFYVEPFIIFLIIITTIKNKKGFKKIFLALLLSGFITSILAVYQYFSGFWVPYSFWEKNNTFRVTGWYGFPNAVGMYLAPMVPIGFYLVYDAIEWDLSWWNKIKSWFENKQNKYRILQLVLATLSIPLAMVGIIFAKSTGALVGVVGGLAILPLFFKKTRWWAIVTGATLMLGLLMLPADNTIKKELLLQNRTGQLRVDMWRQTYKFLKDKPIFAAGIGSYREEIIPYREDPMVEVFHHPHNLLLTMWVNLGLFGAIAFVWILVWFYKTAIKVNFSKIKTEQKLALLSVSIMTTFLTMGLVDSPYIKNDLAIFFWLPIAVMWRKDDTN